MEISMLRFPTQNPFSSIFSNYRRQDYNEENHVNYIAEIFIKNGEKSDILKYFSIFIINELNVTRIILSHEFFSL